ncbi:MAG: hypothetical protein KAJ40_00775 [Alphaproteobacteria bacterium]|nr:hypothetical protein [Alphaproteobacteria bacterium]
MYPVVQIAFLQCLIVLSFYIIIMKIPSLTRHLPHKDMISGIKDKTVLLAGACMAVAWLLHTPSKWVAITLIENPAYVTMIGLTASLWVLLFYKITGRKETADIWSGLGIVACVAILVMFTQL